VEIPLALGSHNDPTLLKEVPIDIGTRDASIPSKADPDELPEPRGIVIPRRLGVTKRFQDRIRLEDLVGECGFGGAAETTSAWSGAAACSCWYEMTSRRGCVFSCDGCEVLDDFLRILRLARSRFSAVLSSGSEFRIERRAERDE
jgi:hypothetical protein